jgi:hypothetical protein
MKNKMTSAMTDEREARLVRKDFTRVVVLNLLLMGLMIGAYFWDRSTGQLDKIFSDLIKF